MEKSMELNKETAMRLWTQQHGKAAKSTDFAGREIAKAAYNDRGSKFGWNVDHILPQSRGGKTADYNLICCHIKTNDEKADKFPCFQSNGRHFEIQKRQNHYEIFEKSGEDQTDSEMNDGINFFDAAQGMNFWKRNRKRSENTLIGYAKIRVNPWQPDDSFFPRFHNFIEELFDSSAIFSEKSPYYSHGGYYSSQQCRIYTVLQFSLPTLDDTENFLDDCIVLNTYSEVFEKRYQKEIQICCGMKCYDSSINMGDSIFRDIINKRIDFPDSLAIDELIRINTSARQKISEDRHQEFYPYDIVFTDLQKGLTKYL